MKETLFKIQQEFKSSKNLVNDFAKFNYRNLESMLADLKPILAKYNCIITFNDDIVNVGVYNYIKSTATITSLNTNESISTTAFAREDETKAGMSAGQMTGCGSSYSRKYALCGLCAVNEEKDLDAFDNRPKQPKAAPKQVINDHREYSNDELEWTPEDNRQPVAMVQMTKQLTPAEELTQWYQSITNADPQTQRFYKYYLNKISTGQWKGAMDINRLYNNWMSRAA